MSIYRKAFANRRENLLKLLPSDAVVILHSGSEKSRNGDANYKFRVDSDFLYLTGFKEPNAVAIITRDSFSMFLQEKDEVQEMWHGARLGTVAAIKELGLDEAFPIEELETRLNGFVKSGKPFCDPSIFSLVKPDRMSSGQALRALPVEAEIASLRVIKSQDEIQMMQESANIAVDAHLRAMRLSQFKEGEYNLQAVFDGKFTSNKVVHSYNPIVASGVNALCLHYTENNDRLLPGDLVLIDAGAELEGYASDITRTFPVDGKFSKEQAELYQIVLDANKATIAFAKPGVPFKDLDKVARRVVTEGLKALGYDVSDPRKYFPHGTSHFIGLDVHDVGNYDTVLKEGMAITVEPGIYIKEKGIGIRIEDDIVITKDGNINLTRALPKELTNIEETILNELK